MRGFSISICLWGDQEPSLFWSEWKVTKRFLYLGLNLGRLRDFFILIWIWGQPKGFSILIWMGINQEDSLSWFEPGAIERLLYLNLKFEATKRLLYLGLMLLYLGLNLRQLRGFFISASLTQSKIGGDQETSLSWSKWKVTKRFLYLGTWGDWEASLS